MKATDSLINRLELDDDVHAAVARARRVTSNVARRRAERELAGDLRGADMAAIAQRLTNVATTGAADSAVLMLAEQWRTRLLADGVAAAADFPGTVDEQLGPMLDRARRERETGKPPGAARALFRYLATALKAGKSPPK